MTEYLSGHDTGTDEGLKDALDYAYALATKYGEGAAALSAEMYDAMARLSGAQVPPAVPAATADYGEVAKTVQGIMKWSKLPQSVGSGVGRLVKTAGVDTTMQNALRDGAQWAWIPSGDSCAFCLMLASNGWQNASKKAIKNGHAEHIHNNCDCNYAVRFDNKTTVAGYDPASIKAQFDATEGDTWDEKVKNMRREHDAEKRAQSGGKETGGHHYPPKPEEKTKGIIAANCYESFSRVDDSEIIARNTGFDVEDIRAIRSHIFFSKHNLDDGYERFAPDYDMAVAWDRLKKGNFLSRDLTLLNHELLESRIEKEYTSLREAHEKAQEQFDWAKQLVEETEGRGEKDGLLQTYIQKK